MERSLTRLVSHEARSSARVGCTLVRPFGFDVSLPGAPFRTLRMKVFSQCRQGRDGKYNGAAFEVKKENPEEVISC